MVATTEKPKAKRQNQDDRTYRSLVYVPAGDVNFKAALDKADSKTIARAIEATEQGEGFAGKTKLKTLQSRLNRLQKQDKKASPAGDFKADDPRTIRGACVRVPSGDRAYVDGIHPHDPNRILLTYESGLGRDSYPLHMLTLVHESNEVAISPSPQSGIPDSTTVEIVPTDPAERLSQLEDEIQQGIDLVEQGKARIWQAVAAIQQEDLWKLNGSVSFEAYCKQKWGWERSNAFEVATAGRIVGELKQSGIPDSELPTSVSQTRELAKLPATERPKALKHAHTVTNGKPTAKAIKEAGGYEFVPFEQPRQCWGDRWGKTVEGQAIAQNKAGFTRVVWEDDSESDTPTDRLLWERPEQLTVYESTASPEEFQSAMRQATEQFSGCHSCQHRKLTDQGDRYWREMGEFDDTLPLKYNWANDGCEGHCKSFTQPNHPLYERALAFEAQAQLDPPTPTVRLKTSKKGAALLAKYLHSAIVQIGDTTFCLKPEDLHLEDF